jgi:hypothetical protein
MIMSLLTQFADKLSASPLPALVTSHDWLVPAIQVIHILFVAAVVIAAVHINLRVLGLIERDVPLEDVSARFLPILWKAVAILAVTGLLLIASEPNRAIFRSVFWVKLAMVLLASLATGAQRSPVAITAHGAIAGRRKVLAVAALTLWALTIFAGRWIAYADPWPGAPA